MREPYYKENIYGQEKHEIQVLYAQDSDKVHQRCSKILLHRLL